MLDLLISFFATIVFTVSTMALSFVIKEKDDIQRRMNCSDNVVIYVTIYLLLIDIVSVRFFIGVWLNV